MSSTMRLLIIPSNPRPVIVLTALGLALSTSFSIGSLTLTYFALPAILLPSNAPLMPPLELVKERRARHFRTEPAPMQPADSGVGDEQESILDNGATTKVVSKKGKVSSSKNFALRQWFHVFAKGMHTFPPLAVAGALCYTACAVLLPGKILQTANTAMLVKRGFYGLSALLSGGIMVFTLTAMKPVNSALHKKVEEVVKKEEEGSTDEELDEETEILIRQWGRMNSLRSILPVLAGLSAVIGLTL